METEGGEDWGEEIEGFGRLGRVRGKGVRWWKLWLRGGGRGVAVGWADGVLVGFAEYRFRQRERLCVGKMGFGAFGQTNGI